MFHVWHQKGRPATVLAIAHYENREPDGDGVEDRNPLEEQWAWSNWTKAI